MLLYGLKNFRINDSWYCKEGDTYHAFFLQTAVSGDPQSCGHMTSKDLIHWDYAGVVLQGKKGTWNDVGIATGSVVKFNGRWYMLYTGVASGENTGGIGVAVSDDLYIWKRVGDGPAILINKQKTPYGKGYPFQWSGEACNCYPLADPYIYPQPIDGEYYIFVNSQAYDLPYNKRAAMAIFKTKDFEAFEPYKLAILDDCDRIETPQVWKHGEKYYMYGGRVFAKLEGETIAGWENSNWIYTSDNLTGPYKPIQKLHFIRDASRPEGGLYIAKVMDDPAGRKVMLVNHIPYGAVGPYPVHYLPDGTIALEYKNRA